MGDASSRAGPDVLEGEFLATEALSFSLSSLRRLEGASADGGRLRAVAEVRAAFVAGGREADAWH